MNPEHIAIMWFRKDLRLTDNPALVEAAAKGRVLPVFVLDDDSPGKNQYGSASRWWLHHSLEELNKQLNGQLHIYKGDAKHIIPNLAGSFANCSVHWNRSYEPWRIQRDKTIKALLAEKNIESNSFNGSLLWEPWETLKRDGTPYKVFTPFYRNACASAIQPRTPVKKPKLKLEDSPHNSLDISALNLLPKIPWDAQFKTHWQPGEAGARKRTKVFIKSGIKNYKEGRNFPDKNNVSYLSPHLHWGELSPHQIWHDIQALAAGENEDCFKSELGWREFSHALLYYFPTITHNNLQSKFDAFPWKKNARLLKAWQEGKTGYPIVDAGMRELWQTGYMHNRVRMITGSFLVKNLLIHWHYGAKWFWDCLLDADLANNSASWQWIAGCGADAAPYFRIFNPVTQGQKFDSDGAYTRRFVPELANLPDKLLFSPWLAPDSTLQAAGVELGVNYPNPIVDIKTSRVEALDAFQSIRR